MTEQRNRRVVLRNRPGVNGEPRDENFAVEDCETPAAVALQSGDVIVRSLYLSVDPAFRCCMNEDTGAEYLCPCQLGETVHWLGVGVVTESKDSAVEPGIYVTSNFTWPWQNIFIMPASKLKVIPKELLQGRPSLALSALGVTGLTAYLGIKEKGHVTPGANQTLVISGAAGSTGSLAGQIALNHGCGKVVGICGSQEKCHYLVSDLGFHAAVNYKTDDVDARLKQTCPDGIDIYFDNVGGDISDKVISQMNVDSHVILCGQIAVYNQDIPYPPPIPPSTRQTLQSRNITRDRFLVLNYADQFDSSLMVLAAMIQQGKLQVKETVMEGIENTGRAFVSMMKGGNIGKQIVKVAEI